MTQPATASQLYAATVQIRNAGLPWYVAGLSKMADAEDQEYFKVPPVDDAGAYRHAAYWQAVASRILASTPLLQAALASQKNAVSSSLLNFDDSNVAKILTAAAANVRAAQQGGIGTNEAVESGKVLNTLMHYATPSQLALAQKDDDSYAGWLRQWQKQMKTYGLLAAVGVVGLGAVLVGALVWFASKRVRKNPYATVIGTTYGVVRAIGRTARRAAEVS